MTKDKPSAPTASKEESGKKPKAVTTYSSLLFDVVPNPFKSGYRAATFPVVHAARIIKHLLHHCPEFNMHHLDRFCDMYGVKRLGWSEVHPPPPVHTRTHAHTHMYLHTHLI